MKSINFDSIRSGIINFFTESFSKMSADTMEWLTIVVLHAATIPTLLAMLTGLSDRAPGLDIILFVWTGLVLLFARSILLKNGFNTVTNGIGFISQAVIMAFILFR